MATTGWFFTWRLRSFEHDPVGKPVPTFPDHAAGNKKAPDLLRRGFGSDDAIVQLRAHISRAPRGLGGFRGAFGADRHGAGTYGAPDPSSTAFGPKIGFNEVEQGIVVTP
jgi:hypothetical protein